MFQIFAQRRKARDDLSQVVRQQIHIRDMILHRHGFHIILNEIQHEKRTVPVKRTIARVGIKKPTQKNPKTHLKKTTKNVFFLVFLNF
jgi:hypothetical protein